MEAEQSSTNQNLTESQTQSQQTSPTNRGLFVFVVISVLLTAIIIGSSVYFWQKSANEKTVNVLEQKISSLGEQISTMKKAEMLPQPTSSPISDSTANWKTYQNENVTFNFPSQWTEKPILIRGSGFTQEFEDPNGKFSLTFLGNGNYNQITGKPYANLEDYINFKYKEKIKKPVTIDGQEGVEIFPRAGSENINSVEFFSKDSKFIYTLELITGNTPLDTSETDVEEGQKLFEQILSSFKFTN